MSLTEYGFTDFQRASSHLIVAGLAIGALLYLFTLVKRVMNIREIPLLSKYMDFWTFKSFVTFIVFVLILIGFLGILDLIGSVQNEIRPMIRPGM